MEKRVWTEFHGDRLVSNYWRMVERVRPARVLCVLKANAYGLGVDLVAKALYGAGCRLFGVADPFEALELKGLCPGSHVQMLSGVLPGEIPDMVKEGIVLPAIDLATARLVSRAACRLGTKARMHFKVDSGMGRLGVPVSGAMDVLSKAAALPSLEIEGVFSHLATAGTPGDAYALAQIADFKAFLRDARSAGFRFKAVHIAASDAINNFPQCARRPFNMVRAGIDLYGSFDPNGRRELGVECVFSLKTRVAQVRTLPAGTSLGYLRTWRLGRRSRIATIAAGYADGLPLALSNRGNVLVNGRLCPVVGRISMDYATVDVSGAGDVRPGDEVVCLGSDGRHSVFPDDWAAAKGTHAYDIICSLGRRVERRSAT